MIADAVEGNIVKEEAVGARGEGQVIEKEEVETTEEGQVGVLKKRLLRSQWYKSKVIRLSCCHLS